MLNISKASLLLGLHESLRENNYRLVNAFFGSRFSRDRRYRIHAMAGTNNKTYGIVGGHMFLITVLKRIDYKPIEFSITLLRGNSILDCRAIPEYKNYIVKVYDYE